MIRSTGTLAFFFLLLFAATAQPQDRPLRDPRIRSSDPEILDAIETGAQASETLRELIAHVEASDIVVYVALRPSPSPSVAAHVSFISAAGGRRYVYVGIDPRYSGCQLMALLGHELQHVVEIADEPSVVDEHSLAEFYRRIGFAANAWALERFETQRAIDAGQRVMREMLAPGSAASRAR